MNWQQFLLSQGAQINDAGEVRFSSKPTASALVIPLTHFGLIEFSGEESVAFLHGQVSSDLKNLADGACQYSSYSTPKGRMLASLLLLKESAHQVRVMLPHALLAATLKRLQMYVLRSKTKGTDCSEQTVLLGLCGPQALTMASALWGELPAEMAGRSLPFGQMHLLPGQRLLIQVAAEHAESCWQQLIAQGAQAASADVWTLADIRAGIPWVLPATVEEFVPQMANMDLIGAISFKKGCYPGQEIVARTHYLGKLKRRSYRYLLDTPCQVGDELFSPEMNGQTSGKIALCAANEQGQWEALAVVQSSSNPHGLHLGDLQGPLAQLQSLPYPVDKEEQA